MTKKATRLFLPLVIISMMLAALLFGGGGGMLPTVHSDDTSGGGQGEKYRLEFEKILSNKIDGISYDVTFENGGGGFFANAVAMPNATLVLEATTIESDFSIGNDGLYGLTRAGTTAVESYLYAGTGTSTFYVREGHDNRANIFQNGKKTVVTYTPNEGPTIQIGDELLPEDTFTKHPGVAPTWAQADEAGAKYFGYTNNASSAEYTAKLTDVKYYNKDTRQDIGLVFSAATKYTKQRMGTAGETITVTPPSFGEGNITASLEAVSLETGKSVQLQDLTRNADGSWSFTMPAEHVTVRSVYRYENHYSLDFDESMVCKLDNVSYLFSLAYMEGSAGWITSRYASNDNIVISYKTELMTANCLTPFGYVRFPSSEFSADWPWLYTKGAWQAATWGSVCYHTSGTTRITYDVTEHKFSYWIERGEQLEGGDPHPCEISDELQYYPGGGPSMDPAVMDTLGADMIGLAWNDGKNYAFALSDYRIMDAAGWDLGVQYSRSGLDENGVILERYAEQGKTITIRLANPDTTMKTLNITDENGVRLNLDVTAHEDGTYTFEMPQQNIRVSAVYRRSAQDYYGSYYNAETGNLILLSDESLVRLGNVEKKMQISLDSTGEIEMLYEEGDSDTAQIEGSSITYDGKIYSKLRSYLVQFVLNGGEGSKQALRVDSGNYLAARPENPTKEGYTFAGWKTSDGEDFDFNRPVTESVTLYAAWTPTEVPSEPGCGGVMAANSAVAAIALLTAAISAAFILKSRNKVPGSK